MSRLGGRGAVLRHSRLGPRLQGEPPRLQGLSPRGGGCNGGGGRGERGTVCSRLAENVLLRPRQNLGRREEGLAVGTRTQ